MTTAPGHIAPLPDTRVDNGILARVPGEYVGKAQFALPDAALVTDDEIRVEVDAGWLGRVRLTFKKYRYTRPKGKFSAVAWSCRHAERVEPVEAPLANQHGQGNSCPRTATGGPTTARETMCSNYEPVTDQDLLMRHFGVTRPDDATPLETQIFPGGYAQFVIRRSDRAALDREGKVGQYGLLPDWADNTAFGRKTYNCRSETAASKPSFREAWKKGRRCIIPARRLFEPCWETGEAVRWAVKRRDGVPMGVAGLWNLWADPKTGAMVPTYTMLTVNADDHALYRRFHRPQEEKRMPVILEEPDYDAWLDCTTDQAMTFMRQFPAERLEAEPAPLLQRVKKAPKEKPLPKGDDLGAQEQLF